MYHNTTETNLKNFKKLQIMKNFNLVYKGIILNSKPMTEAEAKKQVSSIIMNHGYKPQIVEI